MKAIPSLLHTDLLILLEYIIPDAEGNDRIAAFEMLLCHHLGLGYHARFKVVE